MRKEIFFAEEGVVKGDVAYVYDEQFDCISFDPTTEKGPRQDGLKRLTRYSPEDGW